MDQKPQEVNELDRKALDFIITTYSRTGFCPVSSEIAEYLGVGKGGTMNAILKRLEQRGQIVYNDSRSRFIPAAWRDILGNAKLQAYIDEQRHKTKLRVQKHYAANGRK